MDMPVYPGDPATPGIGAVEGAKKLPLNEITTLTKIPVMPISYEDAEPFLKNLGGSWRRRPGAVRSPRLITLARDPRRRISISSSIGIANRFTTLSLKFRARNIRMSGSSAATIMTRGSMARKIRFPEQVPELEEARAFGELLKQGWKPTVRSSIASGTAKSPACSARLSGPRPMPTN